MLQAGVTGLSLPQFLILFFVKVVKMALMMRDKEIQDEFMENLCSISQGCVTRGLTEKPTCRIKNINFVLGYGDWDSLHSFLVLGINP